MYGTPEGRPGSSRPTLVFFGFLTLSLTCTVAVFWGMATDEPWAMLALLPMYLPYWYYKRLPPVTG